MKPWSICFRKIEHWSIEFGPQPALKIIPSRPRPSLGLVMLQNMSMIESFFRFIRKRGFIIYTTWNTIVRKSRFCTDPFIGDKANLPTNLSYWVHWYLKTSSGICSSFIFYVELNYNSDSLSLSFHLLF